MEFIWNQSVDLSKSQTHTLLAYFNENNRQGFSVLLLFSFFLIGERDVASVVVGSWKTDQILFYDQRWSKVPWFRLHKQRLDLPSHKPFKQDIGKVSVCVVWIWVLAPFSYKLLHVYAPVLGCQQRLTSARCRHWMQSKRHVRSREREREREGGGGFPCYQHDLIIYTLYIYIYIPN